MSVGQVGAGDLGNKRRPSPRIWKDFLWSDTDNRPAEGFVCHEDFHDGPPFTDAAPGAWKGFAYFGSSTSGNAANFTDSDSASIITVNPTADEEAFVLTTSAAAIRITKNSGRKVAAEMRFKVSSIADSEGGVFFGLFEPIVPTATSHIADAATLVDANFIGFHRLEGDGDKLDLVWKANGVTQVSTTDAITLVADTFMKVGFLFDGKETLKWFSDETPLAPASTYDLVSANLVASSFPSDINLTVCLAVKSGSGVISSAFDWIRWGMTYAED